MTIRCNLIMNIILQFIDLLGLSFVRILFRCFQQPSHISNSGTVGSKLFQSNNQGICKLKTTNGKRGKWKKSVSSLVNFSSPKWSMLVKIAVSNCNLCFLFIFYLYIYSFIYLLNWNCQKSSLCKGFATQNDKCHAYHKQRLEILKISV